MKISQTLPGWTALEAPGQPGVTERGHLDSPGGSKQPRSKLRLHGPSRLDSRPWGPPQDLPRTGPIGIVPQGGTREAGKNHLDLGGTREAGKDQLDSLGGTRQAPGTQERTIWTAWEAPGRHKGCTRGVKGNPDQGGRKGPFGHAAQGSTREAGKEHLDSLRGTREAGKDSVDSLRGTREAGKDQLDSFRGTREAPGRQERAIWTAWETPGRQERINLDSLGGTREAGKDQLDSLRGTREAGKDSCEAQGGRKGSIGQPARHREAGKNHLDIPVLKGPDFV